MFMGDGLRVFLHVCCRDSSPAASTTAFYWLELKRVRREAKFSGSDGLNCDSGEPTMLCAHNIVKTRLLSCNRAIFAEGV